MARHLNTTQMSESYTNTIMSAGEAGAAVIGAQAQANLAKSNPEAYVALQRTQMKFVGAILVVVALSSSFVAA